MAVGTAVLPKFFAIDGLRMGVANAGVKQAQRPDITIFELAEGATAAGVFTLNAFCAAPVKICKRHLSISSPRYLLVNTGNANAGTGDLGMQAAMNTVSELAGKQGVGLEQVLPFSTGVIGELLPDDKIIDALDAALSDLNDNHWVQAASAIMTTDTRPKGVSRQIQIAGQRLTVSGISKGSGMIQPNMATMLAYVGIDAKASTGLLQQLISHACAVSFNSITVDGDTSTNDSAILMATGASSLSLDDVSIDELAQVQILMDEVFTELAQLIIKDGEGATKFVHIKISGGRNIDECRQAAFTIAHSPLVKTALFASDANWGRILAALGRAGLEDLIVEDVDLRINDVLIAKNGARAASYTEAAGIAAMASEEIVISIELNRGNADATIWTSDLSHDYVTINAEYRT